MIASNVSKVTPSSPHQNSLQYINADVVGLSLKLLEGRETKQRLVFFLRPILLSLKLSNYSLFCSWIFNSILVSLSVNKLIKMSLIVIYSKFSIFYVPPPCPHCRHSPPPTTTNSSNLTAPALPPCSNFLKVHLFMLVKSESKVSGFI